jgi:signal transduction histidine kinase
MRAVRIAIWLAGAALCARLLVAATGERHRPAGHRYLSVDKATAHNLVALLAITVGLVLWDRRPESLTGPLLTGASFGYVLSELDPLFHFSRLALTVAIVATPLAVALFAHLFLSYPTGRLGSRLERGFVASVYAYELAFALLFLLFYDAGSYVVTGIRVECPTCGTTPLTNVGWHDLTGAGQIRDGLRIAAIAVLAVLVAAKLVRAAPGPRRVLLPFGLAAFALAAYGALGFALDLSGSSTGFWTSSTMFWAETAALFAIPLALAAGVLWSRSSRSAVADLVVELEHSPPGSVRDALARALGDPSLELGLWLPERRAFVDADGGELSLPAPGSGSGRAVTILGPEDAPIAALVHDPALLEQPGLLEAAGAAARFALENERLQAELRHRLDEVRSSRARIVQAGDDERRRLERDLHDGAQQRLLGLGLALRLARTRLGAEEDGAGELLDEAEAELRAALDELRELARGIHPAVLTEQGLAAALRSLAERSTVPVTLVAVPDERLRAPVEAAAYFLVSESLANVAKYAHASRASVRVGVVDGRVLVEVEDDGVGGADAAHGSGLRGLSDRLHALDGELEIDSPPGRGTRIHAEIPCAS